MKLKKEFSEVSNAKLGTKLIHQQVWTLVRVIFEEVANKKVDQ